MEVLKLIQVNIQGKESLHQNKVPFDDTKELNECINCKDCICEDYCNELEEKYFGKEGD